MLPETAIPSHQDARRWLVADQLGPHFLDGKDQPVLLIESKAAFGRRPRMSRQVQVRRRLKDLDEVVAQERQRGPAPDASLPTTPLRPSAAVTTPRRQRSAFKVLLSSLTK